MKYGFIPLFMRYSKVPPRPNQKVQYDSPAPVEKSEGLDFKDYPESEPNDWQEHYYYNPKDDCYDDNECVHKPDENKDMMHMCPLAKSFVCWQSYASVYSPAEAFKKGTIFPELHSSYSR